MKLLQFSDSSGEQEYLVIVEDSQVKNHAEYERNGCTLDGVYNIEPVGTLRGALPFDTEFVR